MWSRCDWCVTNAWLMWLRHDECVLNAKLLTLIWFDWLIWFNELWTFNAVNHIRCTPPHLVTLAAFRIANGRAWPLHGLDPPTGRPPPYESPPMCCWITQPDIKSNPVLLEIVDSASIVPVANVLPLPHVWGLVIACIRAPLHCCNPVTVFKDTKWLYWKMGSGRFYDLILRCPCVLEKLHGQTGPVASDLWNFGGKHCLEMAHQHEHHVWKAAFVVHRTCCHFPR